jgi:hypothetical protein
VYFLASKADAADFLMGFIAEHANNGRFVGKLRTDNGGEFTSNQFADFLKQRGIIHATSPPYTPEYQGKVERLNRTLGEMAHTMRIAAGLRTSHWENAWSYSVHIRNRCPTTSNMGGMTPYERLFGRQPRLHHLRVFGCRAEAKVPDETRRKQSDKSMPGIFVGYDEVKGASKFLPDGRKHWIPIRTVVCDENIRDIGDTEAMDEFTREVSGPDFDVNGGFATCAGGHERNPDDYSDDKTFYRAQSKSDDRPKLCAIKSVQSVTRMQLGKKLKKPTEQEVALVGVDTLGGEFYGQGGINLDVPKSVKQALESADREQWVQAIWEEVQAMETAQVWGDPIIPPPDAKITPLRFIFTKKVGPSGTVERYKARLVFQNRDDLGNQCDESFYAPVVDKMSLRMFLNVVAQHKWYLEQLDVKTAFLNAENDGVDYVKLPRFIVQNDDQTIRQLNKALFGLRRAPKAWYTTFTDWAISAGFTETEEDPCIFLHPTHRAMVAMYVDDMLIAAETQEGMMAIQYLLTSKFQCRQLGEPNFFLGMNVDYDRVQGKILLTQETYIGALEHKYQQYIGVPRTLPIVHGTEFSKGQSVQNPTSEPYSSLVGSLLL